MRLLLSFFNLEKYKIEQQNYKENGTLITFQKIYSYSKMHMENQNYSAKNQ